MEVTMLGLDYLKNVLTKFLYKVLLGLDVEIVNALTFQKITKGEIKKTTRYYIADLSFEISNWHKVKKKTRSARTTLTVAVIHYAVRIYNQPLMRLIYKPEPRARPPTS